METIEKEIRIRNRSRLAFMESLLNAEAMSLKMSLPEETSLGFRSFASSRSEPAMSPVTETAAPIAMKKKW